MSTRRGARGRGRGRGSVRAGSFESGHMPNVGVWEAPASPVPEKGAYELAAATEDVVPIIDDLDCTAEQKLKGAIPLLREEAYQWWLTVKEGNQPKQITWEFFKSAFQGKYIEAAYVDARRIEFLSLTQGDKAVAEYEVEFLRLSRYAKGIVATEYERCVRFEDGLRDNLRVLIAPQRKWDFAVLVEKAKMAEEVKHTERLHREKEKGKNIRNVEALGTEQRPARRARVNGPVRAEGPIAVANNGIPLCAECGRRHLGECWRRMGACLSCGSMKRRIRECSRRPNQERADDRGNFQPQRVVNNHQGAVDKPGAIMVMNAIVEHQVEVQVMLR
ncbi:ATP-dependent zinc metalloprotease FtsH [Gossypium australe]|uniref:ATP-dependent zinc metalloprotease FtsH n=1 Tax=Gossypium australe TaxID=47621 RepID=A0A5B6WUU5_9ROSI|nr:ATP-dependent zinc metalloprotease FtsH [Gossypium australe]